MDLARTPARPEDDRAGYPPLSAHAEGRRRFLKLCALSAVASGLGLELTGCPGDGGGDGLRGLGPDWLPWNDHEVHLAGAMPMPVSRPIAVVVGGGPVAVTFKDGVQTELVVAAVVRAFQGWDPAPHYSQRAQAHAEAVRAAAAEVESSVLGDAAALDAFEARLLQALSGDVPDGYVEEVSVAKAGAPPAPLEREEAADEGAPSEAPAPAAPQASEPAPAAASAARVEAPATAAKAQARAPLAKGEASSGAPQVWTPCRTPGCTTCGR